MTVQRTGNLNVTPQYENEHGCRSYVGELPTGHVCMKPETVIHDGRMYCDEHRPQDSQPRTPAGYIDVTPEVLKTPEGAARVTKAMREFEDATAEVANAAELLIEFVDILDPYKEEWVALREAIANRRAKQEVFLRAMANQPERPTDTDRMDAAFTPI